MQYIITGAAGHLGSTIVRKLLEGKQSARGPLIPLEKPSVSGAEYITRDVLALESLRSLFRREKGKKLVVIH